MKFEMCTLVLVMFFASSSCGVTSQGFFNDPRNPGKCTINKNMILSPGDMVRDPNQKCGRVLCGGRGFAEFHTCGVQQTHKCVLGDYVDMSLPYPKCCKRHLICNNNE